MNKNEIFQYMQNELTTLKAEYDTLQAKYNAADHMDRIGICIPLDKVQDKYYHFWMVCNDLGVLGTISVL